ncbi:hypothetical protein PHLCEN_2v10305 [Hermanssonia centrifuga]|uniref:Uncharacterized protein n=1 Tax=Hermanssonia centrifuga TaxID=98765 RepID=A0A2R6NNB3_9APHY|nr:hypothetical protein PHLCEN_2v10305 [Hermanssonia centrifuga]
MQYKIELDVSGCIDNPQHPCDVTERLRLLREAQEAWKTPQLSRNLSNPIYSFPSTALFFGKYHGNVFVRPLRSQTESDGRTQCRGMECVSVGHSEDGAAISQTWKLSFDFPFGSYAVDPGRNLVALLTTIDTAKGAMCV